MPLIAILRGIEPSEADEISTALVNGGLAFMEVTLNSDNWQRSLEIMRDKHGDDIILGAGTVLEVEQVKQLAAIGIKAIISPNMDLEIIKATKDLGMLSIPGCYTPTECFTALKAGADILKIFPADNLGVSHIKAISAVLPAGTKICPTGGVNKENMASFQQAGVFAMGMGSALYKPKKLAADVEKSAREFVEAYNSGL
ncbi:MAG: 2-dehydro-3-deoxy-6-phosphogalactonate aldolase [Rhizobiales bacterium]|nr:2-dehydro-3-deoxy-6-phosphogalactonate aldolase [Hyphomicrobiales bacterium]